jgi:uncharacterized membrane protein
MNNWIVLALVAMFSFSGMILILSALFKRGVTPVFSMLVISLVWTICFGIWTSLEGVKWSEYKSAILLLVIAGLLSVFGNWAQFRSLAISSNPGYTIAIVGCNGALVSLLAWKFFKGEMHMTGAFGVLFCVIGIILISWPNGK